MPNEMKLYKYYEDYGRMGAIEGLLILTDEQVDRLKANTNCLPWDEILGKHSEGYYNFSDETLSVVDIPEEALKVLYNELGAEVSGPFDLDYFEEQISECAGEEEDD